MNTKNSFRELFGSFSGRFSELLINTRLACRRKNPQCEGTARGGHAKDGNYNQSQIRLEYDTLFRRSQ